MATMNKWEVTTDPLTLRRLGKLGEELGELGNVASRCIIQGLDEVDPGTGKVNRQRLADELADVQAQIDCTLIAFGLSDDYHRTRASRKRGQMAEWEALFAPTDGSGVTTVPAPLPGAEFVGWKLVPITPTLAMLDAAYQKFHAAQHSLIGFNARELAYKALLDAAPAFGVQACRCGQPPGTCSSCSGSRFTVGVQECFPLLDPNVPEGGSRYPDKGCYRVGCPIHGGPDGVDSSRGGQP